MPSQPPPLLCRYGHDPLDRLISQTLLNTPARHRFYCKSRLVTEIQGAMHCSIVQHGDQLLAQQQNEAGAIDTSLLATDLQRSVLQTLKGNHPRQSIAYLPYGHRPFASGILSLLGFNGERPDPVTGHYLLGNGYRAFNPFLMRFNSPDSLSPFGKGGLNSYAYCMGDPINRSDPNGTDPITALKSLLSSQRKARIYVARLHKKVDSSLSDEKIYSKIIGDPTPEKAVEAFEEYRVLLMESSHAPLQNEQYLKDLNALQRTNLSDSEVKQRNFLEYIKDEPTLKNGFLDYSEKKLRDLADRIEVIPDKPSPSADKIKSYKLKLMSIRNPNSKTIQDQAIAIRKKYFA
ncbi:RHS repeat-associated core domain-containing protein [Pseudomonas sp. PDM31]|uniref:RHS repeat-associated core domain-containing protein n=1 Tax=Pseudomonas sp. PDM31 TaxID=2854778 RepID=UPI001C492E46|nr:RHS repeat-associated core domain-containing protein [Pseudomonas sp. PDM31]MBV7479698.1 RHS repeat-associated core domain-containing protein [Pseudomonas sp. PDM31]